jgi:glycosyltransferase involved in cell wall biosynthesis
VQEGWLQGFSYLHGDPRQGSRQNGQRHLAFVRQGFCADLALHAPGAEFLPYASAPIWSIDVVPPKTVGRPLVLHAPSDPLIKGTAEIEAALEVLRNEFDFDYRVVKGLPHAEAMKLYREADLVIDQVLAGWYGGFAVELMAMGKPVAAYIRDEDIGVLPPQMKEDLPILRIDPRSLVNDLRKIFASRDQWQAYGSQSRSFVERWHDPKKVSASLLRLYENPKAPLVL